MLNRYGKPYLTSDEPRLSSDKLCFSMKKPANQNHTLSAHHKEAVDLCGGLQERGGARLGI